MRECASRFRTRGNVQKYGSVLGFGLGAGTMRAWKRVTRNHGLPGTPDERTSVEDEREV
jgi:hypothetical protein